MSNGQIVDMAQRAMYVAGMVGLPILGVCLIVGLIAAVFETATQIHEQSLSFVPKIIAVLLTLAIAGGWMSNMLSDFTRQIFSLMARL